MNYRMNMQYTMDKSVFCNNPTGIYHFNLTGPTGPPGPNGQNNLTGPTGIDNSNGFIGPTGIYGPTGLNGVLGPTGTESDVLLDKSIYTIGSVANARIIDYNEAYEIPIPLNTTVIDIVVCSGGGTSTYKISGSTVSSSGGGSGYVIHLPRYRFNPLKQMLFIQITKNETAECIFFSILSYGTNYKNFGEMIYTAFNGENASINTQSQNGSYALSNYASEYAEFYYSNMISGQVETWNVGDTINIIGGYPIDVDPDVVQLSSAESIQISGENSENITTIPAGNGGIIIYSYLY